MTPDNDSIWSVELEPGKLVAHGLTYKGEYPLVHSLRMCHRFGKGDRAYITKLPTEIIDHIAYQFLGLYNFTRELVFDARWKCAQISDKEYIQGTQNMFIVCHMLEHMDVEDERRLLACFGVKDCPYCTQHPEGPMHYTCDHCRQLICHKGAVPEVFHDEKFRKAFLKYFHKYFQWDDDESHQDYKSDWYERCVPEIINDEVAQFLKTQFGVGVRTSLVTRRTCANTRLSTTKVEFTVPQQAGELGRSSIQRAMRLLCLKPMQPS